MMPFEYKFTRNKQILSDSEKFSKESFVKNDDSVRPS